MSYRSGAKSYLETEIEQLIKDGKTDKITALVKLISPMCDALGKCYIRLGSSPIKKEITKIISDVEQTIRED
jgi:hypothetical protein